MPLQGFVTHYVHNNVVKENNNLTYAFMVD